MAGRTLLKALWVAVIVGAATAQLNRRVNAATVPDSEPSAVLFPTDLEEVNLFFDPPPVPIRARERPNCSHGRNDPSAPCVDDGDYNANIRKLVDNLIARSNSVNELVRDSTLSVILNDSSTPVPGQNNGIHTRFGGPTETTVCGAREELIFPQRAKTPKNDWVFVVNQDNVRQALRVERCFKDGEPCDFGIASSRDISTVCRQKYVYRRMLTVGNNAIEPEEVLMPSCCVCYKRSDFDIVSRLGLENETVSDGARTTLPEEVPAAPQPEVVPAAPQPEVVPAAPQPEVLALSDVQPQPHRGITFADHNNGGHNTASHITIRSSVPLRSFPHYQPQRHPYHHHMGRRSAP